METQIDEKIGEKPREGIGLDSPFDLGMLNVLLNCMCQGSYANRP
jgi:hypothetical protein